MIDDLKNVELIEKVGGRFKLTALIQKRLQELVAGARPLIEETKGKTQLEIVIEEIKTDKIAIDYEASGLIDPNQDKETTTCVNYVADDGP